MKTAILSSILTVGLGASAWATVPLTIPVGDSVVVDDFTDGDYNSNLGPWVFSKSENASTLDTSIVDDSGVKALKLNYSVTSSYIMPKEPPYTMQYSQGFVEAKVLLDESQNPVDLSACTEIRFDYKMQNSGMMMGASTFAVIDGNDQSYGTSLYFSPMNYNGQSLLQTARFKWGDLVGDEEAADDVAKNVAAFSWKISSPSMMGIAAQGSLEIANVRCVNIPIYTVKFYKGEELLQSKKYLQGETPSYDGDMPSSGQYRYELRGWDPEITTVTADASYKAILDSSIRSYEVRFYDADENQLMYSYLPYGTVPSYTGINPEKLPTAGYSYTFKGWGKQSCDYVEHKECWGKGEDEYCDTWDDYECWTDYVEEIPPVTEEVSYYPVYDSTAIIYTVKFANADGEILSTKDYAYGTKAGDIVRPTDPTRESKNGIVYTFDGWIPEVSDVSGHVVYVANYSAETADGDPAEIYTVAFVDENGILEVKEYVAGEYPEYTGSAEPSKESSVMFDYIFTDWRDQNGWYLDDGDAVYENKVYMALFDEQYRKYWIVFKDDDGSVLDSIQYEYDSYIDEDDVRELAKSYDDGYSLQKWNPELKRVTGRAVYQAVYSYEARFVAEDFYRSEWVSKGETPECRDCTPEKSPTVEYTYEFVGWDKLPAPLTDTVTYTAVFRAVPIPAAPVTNIAVGDALLIDDFEDGDEISKQGGEWFVYDDSDSEYDYSSEISKTVSVKADGSRTLEVAHKRNCDTWECEGWLGVGVTLSASGNPVDLSQCNAIQYDYRGSEHVFKMESVLDVDYNSVRTYVDSSEDWQTVTIYLSNLKYGTVGADVAAKQAKQFIWSDMMGEGIFELDNIKCLHKPTYVAKFYYGENLIDSTMVAEGNMPKYHGDFSLDSVAEEMSDNQFEYALGWTPELAPATKDAAYTATFTKNLRTFWIDFNTANGWSYAEVEYGKTPVYEGDLTRDPDESCKEYVFDRWISYDEESGEDVYGLFPAMGYRSYRAEYTCKTPVMITITFMDDDGKTILSSKEYPYGAEVSYEAPTKEPSAKYTYRFSGWSPYFQGYAYSNMTYTAQYYESVRYYKVTFAEADGRIFNSREYQYGTLYSDINVPWNPSKYSENARYEFAGWSPALSADDSVTGEVVFVPQYNAEYAVRFVDYNGYTIEVDGEYSKYYPEGTLLSGIDKPDNPTRESGVDTLTYEFVGWLPEIKEGDVLTGPVTFRATYKSSDDKYTITFMNGNVILQQTEVAKDSMPKYEGEIIDPSWNDDEQYSYSWNPEDGWDKEITKVTGPAVYVAKFKQTPKKYTITFKNDDGTVLKTKEYEFGESITDAPTEAVVTANKTGEFRYNDKWCVQNVETDWKCKVDGGKECQEWEEVERTYLDCYYGLQTVSGSRTYVANVEYRVKFYDGDGNLLNENDNDKYGDVGTWFRYGDVIQYCYDNDPEECYSRYLPTKQSTAQYAYTWTGYKLGSTIDENAWTPALVDTVKGAVEYTALFDSTVRNYEVAFEDENGTILKAAESYPYGTPAADIDVPSDPSKNPTATEVYTFAGWNLQNVTRDVTYRASYTVSPRMYKITFVDENEGGLGTTSYSYGTPVSEIALPQAPEKPGYKFAGWTPEVAPVTAEVTYRPQYVPNNQFVVTWRDDDGTFLRRDIYTEGQTPSYGMDPTKESTAQYDYTFNGWTPAIAAVSGDVEYKATYKGTVRKYTVSFVNEDGSPLGTAKEYEYGTPIENIDVPSVPEKPSNEYYVFTFAGWMPTLGEVTGNVTYRAIFGNMKRSFKVTFKDSTGEVWNERTYYYKEVVNVPKDGPNTHTPECEYYFDKWVRVTGESDTVTSDMEYVATHSGTCHTRSYSVMFQDTLRGGWDWSSYPYGTKAEDMDVPTVSDTTIGDCEYRFVKWSPDLADVTSSVGYTTVYEKVCSEQYEVTWLNDDGQELRKSNYNKGEVPTFGATNPVKASSAKYDYRFVGWTPDVVAVTANAQYRAKFDSTVRKFAIQFVNYDGETVRSSAMYEYGTKANLIVAPTIPDTSVGNCTLKFDKWDKEFADVTGAATYVAQYKSVCGTNPPASSSSVVPPASSSSEPPVVSSSSVTPPASSSSVVPPASSSSEPPVVSSSSVTPPASSSSVVPPASSSSVVPPASSSSVPPASSSSVTPPASSSSVVPPASSSSVVPPASSSSVPPASSSSVEPPASSSSGGTTSVNVAQNMLKFGYANNLLTVVQSSPAMVRVQVFDLNGQLVASFNEQIVGSKDFSLEPLDKGSYMVRIMSKYQSKTARIVVK